MRWRCINDIFGYCGGDPDQGVRNDIGQATCKKNPKDCGKYLTGPQLDSGKPKSKTSEKPIPAIKKRR